MSTQSALKAAVGKISGNPRLNPGMRAMEKRPEFKTKEAAQLAGIAMIPEARAFLLSELDREWSRQRTASFPSRFSPGVREVVIGAGFHAAVYCATRVAMGFSPPYVVDTKVGGAFACSQSPSFYLTSENRAGRPGFPKDGDALNHLPGAPVQVSQFCPTEFPTNADMRYVIAVTLAKYGVVLTSRRVQSVAFGAPHEVTLIDGDRIIARRVIDARGCGEPTDQGQCGKRVVTFPQLMARMDDTFPRQGMGRVAVLGGGGSGKTAVEALLGIGPAAHMSVPGLDGHPQIDWYATGLPKTLETWREVEQGRYMRLASYLPSTFGAFHDVTVRPESGVATILPDYVQVNQRTYDLAVMATGNSLGSLGDLPPDTDSFSNVLGNPTVAARYPGYEVYKVGPAADIRLNRTEELAGVGNRPGNQVSMFRLANRTAALAAKLSA